MNIVLFGAPGSGKGTQSALLVERLGMAQISTGDLFRAAIKNNTALGERAKVFMDQGRLVPDEIVIGMVREVLAGLGKKSFILDGFPRTVAQAKSLDSMLKEFGATIDKAVFLEVPNQVLIGRLAGRRVCKGCGAVYHITSKPPKTVGVCDLCKGEVYQRSDDSESVIETRLHTYEENTYPLKSYFRDLGNYIEVNGNQDGEAVFLKIKAAIS